MFCNKVELQFSCCSFESNQTFTVTFIRPWSLSGLHYLLENPGKCEQESLLDP